MAGSVAKAFPLGLGNAAWHTCRNATPSVTARLDGDELVGMMDYASKSVYDLLVTGSTLGSSSNSSGGNHHPSRECFMANTADGQVEDLSDTRNPSNANTGDER